MAISKSLRFKVFNRDHFVCQYCGNRPPKVTLECDHIIAESKGGPTTEENLTTACYDCNRGKGAREIAPPGDPNDRTADMQVRVEQMEAYRGYLEQLLTLKEMELQVLVEHWWEAFYVEVCCVVPNLRTALVSLPPHKIIEAIDVLAGKFPNHVRDDYIRADAMKYFYGIMRRMREERA